MDYNILYLQLFFKQGPSVCLYVCGGVRGVRVKRLQQTWGQEVPDWATSSKLGFF